MRNVLLAASALSGMAAALPQMINIEAALAVPTPTVLGPQATETAIVADSKSGRTFFVVGAASRSAE